MAMHSLTQVAINFYTHTQAVGLTAGGGGALCAGCGGRLGPMQLVCLVVSALSLLQQNPRGPLRLQLKRDLGVDVGAVPPQHPLNLAGGTCSVLLQPGGLGAWS